MDLLLECYRWPRLQSAAGFRYNVPMNLLKALPILFSASLVACTNVAGDTARTIHLPPVSALDSEALFASASQFFTREGYRCNADSGTASLRCAKALRDFALHQTRAVVEIYRGDDEDGGYRLLTARWDEGLIPGEFISGEFTNVDVVAFCDYLLEAQQGRCRPR